MMDRGVPKYGLERSVSVSCPCPCKSVISASRIIFLE